MEILAFAHARFSSADLLLRFLAGRLVARGLVRPTFVDAVLAREASSPTGLPMRQGAVALPHADAEHVLKPALAVATLEQPLGFRQMGDPTISLPVHTVVLLALPDRDSAQDALVRLLKALADGDALPKLLAARDDTALADALVAIWKS